MKQKGLGNTLNHGESISKSQAAGLPTRQATQFLQQLSCHRKKEREEEEREPATGKARPRKVRTAARAGLHLDLDSNHPAT